MRCAPENDTRHSRRRSLKQHFIVFERDPVIAQDISETILELHEQPMIVVTRSMSEMVSAINGQAQDGGYAILDLTSDQIKDQRLIDLLRGRQMRTIVLHARLPGAPATEWTFLPPPFSTAQLQQALRRAGKE